MNIYITKGLPASGKTTWAKEQIKLLPRSKRINKDDIRNMLDDGKWSPYNEKFVIRVRDQLIILSLNNKMDNIIIDDTNLDEKHITHIRKLVFDYADEKGIAHHTIKITIKDFTSVPLETCLERDYMRERNSRVGKKVIMGMYNSYLKPPPTEPLKQNFSLPSAIICDIDGTAALMKNRTAYEWNKVNQDELNIPVASLLHDLHDQGNIIIFVSGRDSCCRDKTKQWLEDNGLPFYHLFMRAENDSRKDSIVKEEIFNTHIKDKYFIKFVLDDRNSTVAVWRKLGLTCFQVAEGDF